MGNSKKYRKPGIIILLFFIIIAFVSSCNTDNCFKYSGDIQEKIIETESFNSIEINDVFTVRLKQDTFYCVVLKAGENILDKIECSVKDKKLVLSDDNGCYWLRSFERPEITIISPVFENIIVNGESDIMTDSLITCDLLEFEVYAGASGGEIEIECNNLKFSLNQGTGKFVFKGKSLSSYFYNLGTGCIYAQNMNSVYSNVTNISTGDIYLNVEEILDVKINSSGDVFYYGDPEVNLNEQSSSGELIKLE